MKFQRRGFVVAWGARTISDLIAALNLAVQKADDWGENAAGHGTDNFMHVEIFFSRCILRRKWLRIAVLESCKCIEAVLGKRLVALSNQDLRMSPMPPLLTFKHSFRQKVPLKERIMLDNMRYKNTQTCPLPGPVNEVSPPRGPMICGRSPLAC